MLKKEYIHYNSGDTVVVWLKDPNRYLQLKEPAFWVFKSWAEGNNRNTIAKECSDRYQHNYAESIRFVDEIIEEIQSLYDIIHSEDDNSSITPDYPEEIDFFSEHKYQFGDCTCSFKYGDKFLEQLFHPLFCFYSTIHVNKISVYFEIFTAGDHDFFKINENVARHFPKIDIDRLQGAVFMKLLNTLYSKNSSEWMSVIHASAVTNGSEAIIFIAPSGSGKSTIAALMLAEGFDLLSDDFVPIALNEHEIYHFPGGISVKSGSISLLQEHFNNLCDVYKDETEENEKFEYYLPPTHKNLIEKAAAKAIIFVNYNLNTNYNLKKESNLEMMNPFIEQAWIGNSPKAAEQFLKWYLTLPVYTLHYSDNQKAIDGIRQLFND